MYINKTVRGLNKRVVDTIKSVGLDTKRKHNRVKYLQNKYEKWYDKGTYNKNQYKRFVHVVSSNYMMTRDQRKQAKELIDKTKLKSLYHFNNHIKGDWRTVVTAICFYIMKKDNSRRALPYNKQFVRSVHLTKRVYDSVCIKLAEYDVSEEEVNTYYLIEKVKSEAKIK